MKKEIEYTKTADSSRIKSYGQYFTMPSVAQFMCDWACKNASSMLDPAVGNSIFLTSTKNTNPQCALTGYEIDKAILEYFGNPADARLHNSDYLLSDWDSKYDAIVCNPPYNRFQAVFNRSEIINVIYSHTGIKYSSYTNLYILFLLKSIYQMSEKGRLAYIIPTEFLNSRYGTPIKRKLIEEGLLKAIINFKNDNEMFFNATTTCCILLLDRSDKDSVLFYTLNSVDELNNLQPGEVGENCQKVSYSHINYEEKWRVYLNQEETTNYKNLRYVSDFCKVTRGIATGANDYFCMSRSKAESLGISADSLTKCICRSADVKSAIFTFDDFQVLAKNDKPVYLLDIHNENDNGINSYLEYGKSKGIDKKALPSARNPWYKMEQRPIAPIFVSTACRNGLKFVRNLAEVRSLTTFHSVYVNAESEKYIDVIFCYFLTPIAQSIIRENRKELGNGLDKFQPNDLMTAKMLDITLISDKDFKKISRIYLDMTKAFSSSQIEELNKIFSSYLISQ